MADRTEDDSKTHTVYQRLRDAALEHKGISLSQDEMDELMSRLGKHILDGARSDDSRIFERVGGASLQEAPETPDE